MRGIITHWPRSLGQKRAIERKMSPALERHNSHQDDALRHGSLNTKTGFKGLTELLSLLLATYV